MNATLDIDFPATLLLHAKDAAALSERSKFLLALKYFEHQKKREKQPKIFYKMSSIEIGKVFAP